MAFRGRDSTRCCLLFAARYMMWCFELEEEPLKYRKNGLKIKSLTYSQVRKEGETVQRRRKKKRLSPATVLGVIVLTLVLGGTMLYQQFSLKAEGREYTSQIKELKKEQKKLEQEQEELEEFKEYVKTDSYAEEIARDKFGLVHKGEIVFEPEEK